MPVPRLIEHPVTRQYPDNISMPSDIDPGSETQGSAMSAYHLAASKYLGENLQVSGRLRFAGLLLRSRLRGALREDARSSRSFEVAMRVERCYLSSIISKTFQGDEKSPKVFNLPDIQPEYGIW